MPVNRPSRPCLTALVGRCRSRTAAAIETHSRAQPALGWSTVRSQYKTRFPKQPGPVPSPATPHPGAQLRTLRAEVRHWARQRSKESASRAYNTPFACWRRQAAGGRMGNVEVCVYDRDRQRTFQLKKIVQMACHRQRARTYTHTHTHRTRTTNQSINQASKQAIKQLISDHDHRLAPAAPFPGATAVLGGGSRPRKTRKRRSNGLMRRIRGTKTARHRSRWSRGSTRFCSTQRG